MSLCLVIHRPEALPDLDAAAATAMRAALAEAVWEVAETHWAPAPGVSFVDTDLSPDYLVAHFRRALARQGFAAPGLLIVQPCAGGAAWAGLDPDAEAWLAAAGA